MQYVFLYRCSRCSQPYYTWIGCHSHILMRHQGKGQVLEISKEGREMSDTVIAMEQVEDLGNEGKRGAYA